MKHLALQIREGRLGESTLGWLLIHPTILVFLSVVLFPLAYSIYLSFHSTGGFGMNLTWVGLENYTNLLVGNASSEFWFSLFNNVLWTVDMVSIQLVLGIALALLLHRSFKGRNIVVTIVENR